MSMSHGDGRIVNMTELYNELFQIIDSGKTIVMPSEDAVRSFLTAYVLERKRSVLKRSCISMSDYLDTLYPGRKWLTKADDSFRILFASELTRTHRDRLAYFIPEDSTEDFITRAIPFIAGILSDLDEAMELEGPFKECITFIHREYTAFMKAAGRYEDSWLPEDITLPEEEPIMVFQSLTPRDARRIDRLRDLGLIVRTLTDNDDFTEIPTLQVYESQKTEIRNTMLSLIDDMTRKNINPNKLAITVTDLDTLRPYIEKDARLFDVKLTFRKGTPIEGTPAGKYLHYSRDLHDSNYDTTVIRNFTMDSALPLKDRRAFRTYTKNKLDNAENNVDIKKQDTEETAGTFLQKINKLNSETDPSEMLSLFDDISSDIFKKKIDCNSITNASYNEIRNKAETFAATAAELKAKGLIGNINLYPLFTEITAGIMMPKDEEEGIAVYEYPESAGLHFERHYVLNVSEDKARSRGQAAEFLSNYEISKERIEYDTTENIIKALYASSDETVFSCSLVTYSGAALPLMGMETGDPELLSDPWKHLHETEQTEGKPFSTMVKGYENASHTSLSVDDSAETVPEGMKIPMPNEIPYVKNPEKDTAAYSTSLIDTWNDCPYKCYLERTFQLQKTEKYEINDNYAMQVGNVVHNALQKFLEAFPIEPGYEQEEDKPIVVSKRMQYSSIMNDREKIKEKLIGYINEELDDWNNRISYDRDGNRKALDSTIPPLTAKLRDSILEEYPDNMTDMMVRILNTAEGWICETPLRKTLKRNPSDPNEEGYYFEGYADLIIRGPNSITDKKKGKGPNVNVDIIDYKTGNQQSGKKQFWIYRELLDSAGFLNENDLKDSSAIGACYQYMKTGKQSQKPQNWDKNREQTLNEILDTAEAIKQGDWHAETNQSCKRCIYRGICRMNFGFAEGESDDE